MNSLKNGWSSWHARRYLDSSPISLWPEVVRSGQMHVILDSLLGCVLVPVGANVQECEWINCSECMHTYTLGKSCLTQSPNAGCSNFWANSYMFCSSDFTLESVQSSCDMEGAQEAVFIQAYFCSTYIHNALSLCSVHVCGKKRNIRQWSQSTGFNPLKSQWIKEQWQPMHGIKSRRHLVYSHASNSFWTTTAIICCYPLTILIHNNLYRFYYTWGHILLCVLQGYMKLSNYPKILEQIQASHQILHQRLKFIPNVFSVFPLKQAQKVVIFPQAVI